MAAPYSWKTILAAAATGILGSNLGGVLENIAFSFEESNTKLSVFGNAGILMSYAADMIIYGISLSFERVMGVLLIIIPLVLLTLHK